MQITTRSRYSTRALVEIAEKQHLSPVSIKSISKKQDIPEKYLETLFKQLKIAGIVKSIRGAGGGYVLSRSASEISVWEVVVAVEERITATDCIYDSACCQRSLECATRDVWSRLERTVKGLLSSISLTDLVDMQASRRTAAFDFRI